MVVVISKSFDQQQRGHGPFAAKSPGFFIDWMKWRQFSLTKIHYNIHLTDTTGYRDILIADHRHRDKKWSSMHQ